MPGPGLSPAARAALAAGLGGCLGCASSHLVVAGIFGLCRECHGAADTPAHVVALLLGEAPRP